MEESISMLSMDWSFFTLVVAIITAYCIYKQNKHYLKIKLALQMISVCLDKLHDLEERLEQKVTHIRLNTGEEKFISTSLQTVNLCHVFDIEKKLHTLRFYDSLKEVSSLINMTDGTPRYEGYKVGECNYLSLAFEALKEDLRIFNENLKLEKDYHCIAMQARRVANTYGIIITYLSYVETYIIRDRSIHGKLEVVTLKCKTLTLKLLTVIIKHMPLFIPIIFIRLKGYTNKLLNWINKIKKMSVKIIK